MPRAKPLCEIKFPVGRNAGTADRKISGQHAVVGCDRARFRPDLSGALRELFAGEGRRVRNQDRAAARRARAAACRARQERHPALRDAEPEQARDHPEPQARARPGIARKNGRARRRIAREFLARHDGRSRRRLDPAARDQPAADLCHRHRFRDQRPRPGQSRNGHDDPGGLGDHERHRVFPTDRRSRPVRPWWISWEGSISTPAS